MNRNLKLAIDGGEPVRLKEFKSLPYLDDDVIERVSKLLSEKKLSKFVGSSIPGTNEILGLSSSEVNKILLSEDTYLLVRNKIACKKKNSRSGYASGGDSALSNP